MPYIAQHPAAVAPQGTRHPIPCAGRLFYLRRNRGRPSPILFDPKRMLILSSVSVLAPTVPSVSVHDAKTLREYTPWSPCCHSCRPGHSAPIPSLYATFLLTRGDTHTCPHSCQRRHFLCATRNARKPKRADHALFHASDALAT